MFAKITPETEDDEPVAVNKLPPIPTPPVTTNAPEVVDVETVLFETNKLEILEAEVDGTYIVPPMNAFPVIPNPPDTVNAPDVVEVELDAFVTAIPETERSPVEGVIEKETTVDKPRAEPDEELTVVI